MRVLHAYNLHRHGGGSDNAAIATVRVLRENGVEVEEFVRDSRSIPMNFAGKASTFFNGIYARDAVRDFTERLKSWRPDLVHLHELYPLISPWVLPRCAEAGIPVVLSCYDFRLTCPVASHHAHGELCHRCIGGREHWCVIRNCRSNLAESVAYALRNAIARGFSLFERNVAHYLVVSDFAREWLVDRAGIAADRVSVTPPAIRIPPEPVADPAAGRYLGFAGRFAPEKGVEVMVDAARLTGLPMGFAGDSLAHEAVRPDDDACFVLTRSPDELGAFYRGARMLVVPSLYYETFNIVAAEAMSHGIPVIAARVGALPETVREGETGLLFEPGNAEDLADKIRTLWDDPERCRELGRNARQRVVGALTEAAHFERMQAVYSEVLGR